MIPDTNRRPYEGLLHFALRRFSQRYPKAFNAVGEWLCRTFGHSYVTSYSKQHVVRYSAGVKSVFTEYTHFCPCCCTFGPGVPGSNIVAWRQRHGIGSALSSNPRLYALGTRLGYAVATLLGRRPNENSKKRIYAVFPL